MGTYCASTDITPYLPTNHGISSWTAIIAAASDTVDSILGRSYWPFPSVSSSPATPTRIKNICARYAAYLTFLQINATNRKTMDGDVGFEVLRRDAFEELERIASGDGEILARVSVSSETMSTLGTDTNEPDMYPYACGATYPYRVFPESVRVTGYRHGIDFYSRYCSYHRKWEFIRLNSAITTSSAVAYDYTYLRQTEIEDAPGGGSGKIIRA